MATKTYVELVDDLDGSEAEESVHFGIDGVTYEIDLSGANADKMREAFEEWIQHARRLSGRSQGGRPSTTTRQGGLRPVTRTQLPDVRPGFSLQERRSMQKFAKSNGLTPPADRGRIAAAVVTAWTEAGRPT